jgi:hypothetical protein
LQTSAHCFECQEALPGLDLQCRGGTEEAQRGQGICTGKGETTRWDASLNFADTMYSHCVSLRGLTFCSLSCIKVGLDSNGARNALGHAENGSGSSAWCECVSISLCLSCACSWTRVLPVQCPIQSAYVPHLSMPGVGKVKFGGGFYCGSLRGIFVPRQDATI